MCPSKLKKVNLKRDLMCLDHAINRLQFLIILQLFLHLEIVCRTSLVSEDARNLMNLKLRTSRQFALKDVINSYVGIPQIQ